MKKQQRKKNINSQIIWTIITLISVSFFVFSFLEVPIINLIHAYSFGLFFGIFTPIFYFGIFLISFQKVVQFKRLSFKYFRPTNFKIGTIIISAIFLTIAIISIIKGHIYASLENEIWKQTFETWWENFTHNNKVINSLEPNTSHYGLFLLFIYSFISWLATTWTVLGLTIAIIIFEIYLILAPENWVLKIFTNKFWSQILVKFLLILDKQSKIKITSPKKNKTTKDLQHHVYHGSVDSKVIDDDNLDEQLGGGIDSMNYQNLNIDPDLDSQNDLDPYNINDKKGKDNKGESLPFDDPF